MLTLPRALHAPCLFHCFTLRRYCHNQLGESDRFRASNQLQEAIASLAHSSWDATWYIAGDTTSPSTVGLSTYHNSTEGS